MICRLCPPIPPDGCPDRHRCEQIRSARAAGERFSFCGSPSITCVSYLRATWWSTAGFGAETNICWHLLVLLLHHPPKPLQAPNTSSWPPIHTTRMSHFFRSRVLCHDCTCFTTLSHCLNLRPAQNGSNLNRPQGARRSECCAQSRAFV